MNILNKKELDTWLFKHVQIEGHTCVGVKGPLQGTEPGDPPAELHNIAWIDCKTLERFDVLYGDEAYGVQLQ